MSYPPPPPSPTSSKTNRNCCIGCVIAVIIVCVLIGIVSVMGVKKMRDFLGFEMLDITAKNDPPANIDPFSIFPDKVNGFTKEFVTTGTEPLAVNPRNFIEEFRKKSKNSVSAKYRHDSGSEVIVTAIPAKDFAESTSKQNNPGLNNALSTQTDKNLGLKMKIPFGENGEEERYLMWGKNNWAFGIYTTDTLETKFFEAFNPPAE